MLLSVHTASADKNLCGHFNDFGALEFAFDALRFGNGCAVSKDARRSVYVKYCSATSEISILTCIRVVRMPMRGKEEFGGLF